MRVVAVGTGQAIKLAKNGDTNLLLIYNRPLEERFVAECFRGKTYDLMYNDLVIVGGKADAANIGGIRDAVIAF